MHIALAGVCAIVALCSVLAFSIGSIRAARARAQEQSLQAQDDDQRRQLLDLTRRTEQAWQRLGQLQRSNEQIRRLTSAKARAYHVRLAPPAAATPAKPSSGGPLSFVQESDHLAALNQYIRRSIDQSDTLKAQAVAVIVAERSTAMARQRYLDAIPSLWPTSGSVSSGFGYRTDPEPGFHAGLDIVNDYGASVYATADGVVTQAGWDGGFGNKLIIDHGNGFQTWYAHNSQITVSAGQQVRKGQEIARVGATGFATGPHVHYEVLLWGKPIDPTPFLNGIPAQVASAR
ncbi:MAG: M23 family metallopeptidase [Candidatus Eremiobacteraeota bacterium]|nr:M23 family metallopeptidase [Candidatus Eremiobacteraeota bacterium]